VDTDVRHPFHILVVEDDWVVRIAIADFLRVQGYIVAEAATGEEALALLTCDNEPVDLLFTDIQLGGRMSGWEVAEAFRTAKPHSPVVYASGHPPDERRRVSGSLFFRKPYVPDKILRACRSLALDPLH
jgi:two-component system OmpR family response regulator